MAASEQGSRVSAREPFLTPGYRAALERVAFLPDGGRRVVAVSGAAAVRVINGLASNDATEVERGRAVYSYFLERRGRVVVDLRLLPPPEFETAATPSEVWLDVPATGLEPLLHHLKTYVPPILAVYRPTAVRTASLVGPLAAEALGRRNPNPLAGFGCDPNELEPLQATTMRLGDRAGLLVRREDIEGPGFDVYVDPGEDGDAESGTAILEPFAGTTGALRGTVVTEADREILRVERGLPAFGTELGPERLAQEAGQEARAISFSKGCFTGQEVVARIHYRGHVNRRLRGIRAQPDGAGGAAPDLGHAGRPHADRSPIPPRRWVGSELYPVDADSPSPRPVGVVTSAVESPRFGLIGLAYLRREVAPGDVVRSAIASTPEFQVVECPFTNK